MAQYQADLAQCKQLSEQVDPKAAKAVVGGAIVGAIAGEIIDSHRSTEIGAGLGALKSGASGGAGTRHERTRVVKNCLRHRGYHILN